MSSIAIFMADGCEEIEALTVVDLLRRGKVTIDMLSITEERFVTGSHGIRFETDDLLKGKDLSSYDGIVLPGGMPGTMNLKENGDVQKALKEFAEAGKLISAICAAPARVLGEGGFLMGYEATCYPSCEEGYSKTKWRTEEPVVCDRNIITGKGPGAAYLFALKLVEFLYDKSARQQLENDTMFN